jgi:hypothetical protein
MLMPRLAVGEGHALYVSMCKVIDSPGLAFLAEKTGSPPSTRIRMHIV